MHKISKIVPILCIIVITILMIVFLDLSGSRKYIQLKDYNIDYFYISYDSHLTTDSLLEIKRIAEENNVVFGKNIIEGKKRKIYLSVDNSEELLNFMDKIFNLKVTKLSENGFISTKKTLEQNQIAYIPDLLNNDDYNYYSFSNYLNSDNQIFGSYIIYCQQKNNCDDFKKAISDVIVQNNVDINIKFNNSQNYVLIVLLICSFILLNLYFIFQIFDTYKNSKKIGCMRMLGFSDTKILNKLSLKKLYIYLLFIFAFIFLPMIILIENITVYELFIIIFVDVIAIFITYGLNYLSVKLIFNNYSIIGILKEKNISQKIKKLNDIFKIFIVVTMVIGIFLFLSLFSSFRNSLFVYNNSEDILNYMIIDSVDGEFAFSEENNIKSSTFYKLLLNDPKIKTFYAYFPAYINIDDQELDDILVAEKSGTFYRYGTVDRNYLLMENIDVYTIDDVKVSYDELPNNFFLFPKSKLKIIDDFEKFYNEEIYPNYINCNLDIPFIAYIYKDQSINSYTIYIDEKYIESPIIRVANEEIYMLSIINNDGLSLFGNGLMTGLKIEVDDNKEITYRTVEKYIKEAKLDMNLSSSNFLYYKDYFNNEILISKVITVCISIFIFAISIVYLLMTIQSIYLFINSYKQEITIKRFLGFESVKIFNKEIKNRIISHIISFCLAFIILLILNVGSLFSIFFVFLILAVIDTIITMIIINKAIQKTILKQIKGGNYD